MEDAIIITGLLEKRAEIERSVAELERQVRKLKAEIGQIDATITLFAPDVVAAKRKATRFARSAFFVTGELMRRCQDGLREAKGKPITVNEIATKAMSDKGIDPAEVQVREDFNRRLLWTMNRMLRRGAVQKIGYGSDAKWALPS